MVQGVQRSRYLAVSWALRLSLTLICTQIQLSTCHVVPEPGDIIQGVVTNQIRLLRRRDLKQSLRISLTFDATVKHLGDKSKRDLIIDKLLPEAVAYFHQTFNVRRPASSFLLQPKCSSERYVIKENNETMGRYCSGSCDVITKCGPVFIPVSHLDVCRSCDTNGKNCSDITTRNTRLKNTDYILYVSAYSTTHCTTRDDIIAYAAVCQQESELDRPIAGFVNFCEQKLTSDIHNDHLLAIVKHEIYHALGFSSALYGYYRDSVGGPLTDRSSDGRPMTKWSDKVVQKVARDNWKVSESAGSVLTHDVEVIVTPNVLREVRSHFSCPSLEGAEIENQGSDGQHHSHWEKRLFENEAMTGVFTHNPVFSRISLALMEDTGWYTANYDMAEELKWGKNAGCLLAKNSCKAWIDYQRQNNHSILPYCDQKMARSHTRTSCTSGYDSVGVCNLVEYKTLLPAEYRYFDDLPGVDEPGLYAGGVHLADYCPFVQELDWKKNGKAIRGSSCKHKENNLELDHNYALEEYGNASACFLHGRQWSQLSCKTNVTAVDWGSGCYSYSCTEHGVELTILDTSYHCRLTGQEIQVRLLNGQSWLHEGTIICPPCEKLCERCPFVDQSQITDNIIDERHHQPALVCSSTQPQLDLKFLLIYFNFLLILYIR